MEPRIFLNMIVKNEEANLPRLLDSVIPHVTGAVILDTGSSDETIPTIEAYFKRVNKFLHIAKGKFVNFSQARNSALCFAQACAHRFDYLLLADADMELVVDGPLGPLAAESYTLEQRTGFLRYFNTRLLRAKSKAQYVGVTHEYIGTDDRQQLAQWWFKDHCTGSNRGDKSERDKRLLEADLTEHPNDARTMFYLARTYKEMGLPAQAIPMYRRRIAAGGWDEEIWYSLFEIAQSYRELGDEGKFIATMLEAHNMRPTRAEPLYHLARYYREKPTSQRTAWMFSKAGIDIKYPKDDALFIEAAAYRWGFEEELSILGCYQGDPKAKERGFVAANRLSTCLDVPELVRHTARRNLYYYLQPLSTRVPGLTYGRIPDMEPGGGYVNTNPSVFYDAEAGELKGIVRNVSYSIRPDGTYDYNGRQAIETDNWLVTFDGGFGIKTKLKLSRPTNLPAPAFKGIIGIEDLRLFSYKGGGLCAVGCMLEQNEQAWREQFLVHIDERSGALDLCRRITPQFISKQHEKNWMPIIGDHGHERMLFMYRPGIVMDGDGAMVSTVKPVLSTTVDNFSGSSQLIPFDGGWLGIIHTADQDPTNGKRHYYHRFVWYNHRYELIAASKPFVFFERGIEFCTGLALDRDELVISFGIRDAEAWLARVPLFEARHLLWND